MPQNVLTNGKACCTNAQYVHTLAPGHVSNQITPSRCHCSADTIHLDQVWCSLKYVEARAEQRKHQRVCSHSYRQYRLSNVWRRHYVSVHTNQNVARCHGTARHSTAQHSTSRHGTAQHSTAQHGTARHSTAQHSRGRSYESYLHCIGSCIPSCLATHELEAITPSAQDSRQ